MKRIEIFTGIGKSVPAQVVFQDTRELIKWGQEYIDELFHFSPDRWGEIWLTNGGDNRTLVVNREEFHLFTDGLLSRWNLIETSSAAFYLAKIKSLRTAKDWEVIRNG